MAVTERVRPVRRNGVVDGERADSNRSPFGFDQVTLCLRPALRARGGEGRSATAHDTISKILLDCLSCVLLDATGGGGVRSAPGRMFRVWER